MLGALFILSSYGLQGAVPQVLIFSGPSERINYQRLLEATKEPLENKMTREVNKGDCLIRLSSNTFAYVTKSVPSVKEVRAREYFYKVIYKYGLQKSIPYSEIGSSEFKDIFFPFWWENSNWGPGESTKFSVTVSLASTLKIGSYTRTANFAPRQRLSNDVLTELSSNPIRYIRNDQDALKYRNDNPNYGDMPFSITTLVPINHDVETELIKDSLDLLKAHLKNKLEVLDSEFDKYVSKDSSLQELTQRRSAKTLDDLKRVAPRAYEATMSMLNDSSAGPIPSNESGAGTLAHRYDLQLFFSTPSPQARVLRASITRLL